MDTLAPGQRVGPFVLLAPLGSGGSGRIWAVARLGQLGFNKRMVLKVMRQDKLGSASARERFDREACLGGQLRHANLRGVHDLGSHEGRPFMALSWVDTSLSELLEHAPERRLDVRVTCWLGIQCCSALAAAHGFVESDGSARPIVHRDVSPGNILLSLEGHALLADLAAPARDTPASPRGEAAGPRFFGSLAYAAPEALRQEPLDGRADLFSLGCVLYEMLAGAPAFEGDDERNVMFQILERGAPDVRERAPDVPEALAALIRRCLERRPEQRPESAQALRAALSACVHTHSGFELERHTAQVLRQTLGVRIREREEALHLAYQRFAPSPFERTDTLPIGRTTRADGSTLTLTSSATKLDAERDLSRAGVSLGAPSAARRRAAWPGGVLVAALVSLGVFTWRALHPEGATRVETTRALEAAPLPAPAAPAEPAPAPASAPPTPSVTAPPVVDEPPVVNGPARPAPPKRDTQDHAANAAKAPAARHAEKTKLPENPRPRNDGPRAPASGAESASPTPSAPPAPRAFEFHFDDSDPYVRSPQAAPPPRDTAPPAQK
jgi:serine/threonine-protein kinase